MNHSVNRNNRNTQRAEPTSNPQHQEEVVPVIETVLGKKFINNKFEEVHLDEIQKAHIIFVFFTGLWCNPCQEFAEELVKFYQKVNESMKTLEVIHISLDRSEEDFKKDIADKPWLFIPYNEPIIKDIATKYDVKHIPRVLLINKEYAVVSDSVRKDILEQGIRIVDKWIKLLNSNKTEK